jgi:pimeloyl-ACP methyl ester carboxylesterase
MTESRKKRSFLRWIAYALGALLVLLLLLAAIGGVYEAIASSRDRHMNPPPGRLVNVDGYQMHLVCTGAGTPTVVLESGLGDAWLPWYKVQPAISKVTQVCSYDRAGLGFSDPRPEKPDSRNIAHNLRALLAAAGVNPPYVLVGHSIGGIHVRVYQHLYPADAVGIVLVDSSHPDQEQRLPPEIKKFESRFYLEAELLGLTMPLGLPRLTGACGRGSPEIAAMQRTIECRWQTVKAAEAELRAFSASADEGRETGSLGTLPLVVLSHDPNKGAAPGMIPADVGRRLEDAWVQMQEELAHLSTNGSRIVATGSTHYVQLDRPDLVIAAVRNVLNESRAPAK